MFKTSLTPYFVGLSLEAKRLALRAVAHYVLFNDYKEYRTRIRALSDAERTLFFNDVRNLVKSSFECRKIWRTVRYALGTETSFEVASKLFYSDLADVEFCWRALGLVDQDKLKKEALTTPSQEYRFMNPDDLKGLLARLDKHCGKVSFLKLRFIADNDNCFELSDLKAELLVHGLQVVRYYEYTNDLAMIENYAKASIQNYAINLIQRFTSESRACVVNTTVGCGTCIWCLTDKAQRCSQAVADYSAVTFSIDSALPAGFDAIPSETDARDDSQSLLTMLRKEAEPNIRKVVDLVFGSEVDEDFEIWLDAEHGITLDELASYPKRLIRYVCEYLDVPSKQVSAHLRSRYFSYKSNVA